MLINGKKNFFPKDQRVRRLPVSCVVKKQCWGHILPPAVSLVRKSSVETHLALKFVSCVQSDTTEGDSLARGTEWDFWSFEKGWMLGRWEESWGWRENASSVPPFPDLASWMKSFLLTDLIYSSTQRKRNLDQEHCYGVLNKRAGIWAHTHRSIIIWFLLFIFLLDLKGSWVVPDHGDQFPLRWGSAKSFYNSFS